MWFRRRWCPQGIRPPFLYQDTYQWLWLYIAAEPASGETFILFLPALDGQCFEVFLRYFHQQFEGQRIGILMDNAPAHSQSVKRAEGIELLHLPSYSPELNPAERIIEELRKLFSNTIFESVAHMEQVITDQFLSKLWQNPPLVMSLTSYPWIMEALANIRN